ncbi:MAG: hypothetical protein QM702_03635 [Rubrivivax sp.]
MAQSTKVAWHYAMEQYEPARRLLETMDGVQNEPVTARGVEPKEVIGHVYAMTGPAKADLVAAMLDTDLPARIAKLEAAIPKMPTDVDVPESAERIRADSAVRWVKRRIEEAKFLDALKDGQWKPLPIAEDLNEWRIDAGQCVATKLDDGSMALDVTSDNGISVYAPFALPERYEFRCKLEWTGGGDPLRHDGLFLYPAWAINHPIGGYFDSYHGRISAARDKYAYVNAEHAFEADGSTTPYFRFDRGAVMWMGPDGASILTHRFPMNATRRIGFGTYGTTSGCKWRISKIEVRKL